MSNKRWLDILDNLSDIDPVTSEEMALKLGLSSRTIRKEMSELKSVIEKHGAVIASKTNAGYLLRIQDTKKYEHFIQSLSNNNPVPENSQERIQYLLETLLANDQYVKMEDLCEQMYVSRSSLTADLRAVRKQLSEYNLKLIAKPSYGIRVVGEEFNLRLCIAASTIGRIEKNEDLEIRNLLTKINDCIQEGLKDSSLRICDITYQNLVVHIYIALKRIQEQCHVPLAKEQLGSIAEEIEYDYAKKIVQLLEKTFSITIPNAEIGYIAIHLASKRIIEHTELNDNFVIDSGVNDVVTRMLNEIEHSYNIRFHDDFELRMVLAMHLIPFSVRMKYDMSLKNPLLKEIKTRYTLAYMVAVTACEVLKNTYHNEVNEHEIGYFALHFNLALERKRSEVIKHNIVIVCSTGRGSAQMLVYRMREEFGKYLNHIETCDVFEINNFDFTNIDYIITTVPIPYQMPRPVLMVQVFFEEKDIMAIHNLLHDKNLTSLQKYFHPDLFISNLAADNKEEAIQIMVDKIKTVKTIPNNFFNLVMERENLAFTAFGNKVAIPHPNMAVTDETFVCVAVLKKAILWDNQKVQFIFMLSLKKNTDENLQYFSKITSKLLFSAEGINEIIKKPEYSVFMNMLGAIEKDIENNKKF